MAPLRRGLRRRRRGGRLPASRAAARRGPRRVPADRDGHRRRQQGDVRLRRQGRPPRRPPSRADGVDLPGLRPAPPGAAVEGVVRGAAVPLREAPARPLPAVRPGRRRGARRGRPAPRRGGHRPRLALLRGARPAAGHAAAELARRTRRPGSLRRRPASPLRRCRRRAERRESRNARAQPAAGARLQAPRGCRADRRRAVVRRLLERRGGSTLRHRSCRPRRARRPVPGRAAARAGARLLPAHDVRVRRRHARQRPERARRRRPLRRARRGIGRAVDTRHRVRHRPRPDADRLRRRGSLRRREPPTRRVRRRHDGRRRGARRHRAVAARRPLRRPGVRRAQHEGADEGGRPQRGIRRRDHRRRRARRRHGGRPPAARRRTADVGRPRRRLLA